MVSDVQKSQRFFISFLFYFSKAPSFTNRTQTAPPLMLTHPSIHHHLDASIPKRLNASQVYQALLLSQSSPPLPLHPPFNFVCQALFEECRIIV